MTGLLLYATTERCQKGFGVFWPNSHPKFARPWKIAINEAIMKAKNSKRRQRSLMATMIVGQNHCLTRCSRYLSISRKTPPRIQQCKHSRMRSFKSGSKEKLKLNCNIPSQGPAAFVIIGSIKVWQEWKEAHTIKVETLLVNGKHDEVTNLAMYPWFKVTPKVKWVTLEGSIMSHWDNRENRLQEVGDFWLAGPRIKGGRRSNGRIDSHSGSM